MNATQKFEKYHVHPLQGRTLIVGSRVFSEKEDRRGRYKDAVGIDMEAGEGVDVVLDMEEAPPHWLGTFAHIEVLSVIEHSRRPWLMAVNLESLLEIGGTLYASVPLVWRLHNYPADNYRVSPSGLRALFEGIDWEAMSIATDTELLGEDPKRIPFKVVNDRPFFQRCETLGFGRKRSA